MIFSCYEVSHKMKGNIQEVTERCWWPRLFWLWCCYVRKQEESNYIWLNMQCIFLQVRLLVCLKTYWSHKVINLYTWYILYRTNFS